MPERSLMDQLELSLEAMFAGRPLEAEGELAGLVRIAQGLRDLPRHEFRERLKSSLERKAIMPTAAIEKRPALRQTATAHLRVRDARAAIDFYKNAFGARELMRFEGHGDVAHAELEIGNTIFMLGEAAPDYGFPGPEGYGGSPMTIQLNVDDVDAFVGHAVKAGARIVAKVEDHFYGDRSGSVADPFGYTWGVATAKEPMDEEEMQKRFQADEKEQTMKPKLPPRGYRTLTPYVIVQDAPALIDFARQVFGGEETFRAIGSAGGIHAEIRIGDSMLMMGGGGPELKWRGDSSPSALHVYVEDTDAAYARALDAGASSISAPVDQPYGERGASIKDQFGNFWYIATAKGESYTPPGLGTVTPYLHPLRAEPVISFLKRAFGAEEIEKYPTPDGVIHHAKVKIGDSFLEMGESHGEYQPMPCTFYLYVPNVDATYQRALTAGATSIAAPVDHDYGDRGAGVKDVFGNTWYIATHLRGE